MNAVEKFTKRLGKANKEACRRFSLIYLTDDEIKTSCEYTLEGNLIVLAFFNNGGKFGTEERLDEFRFTSDELLKLLQDHK